MESMMHFKSKNVVIFTTLIIVAFITIGSGTFTSSKKTGSNSHAFDKNFTISSLEINQNRDPAKGAFPGFTLRYRSDFTAQPVLLSTMPSYGEPTTEYLKKTDVFSGIEFHSNNDVGSTYDYQDYISYHDVNFLGEWNNPEYTFIGNETYGRYVFKQYRSTEKTEQNLIPATAYILQVNSNLELVIWHDDTTELPLSIDLSSLVIENE